MRRQTRPAHHVLTPEERAMIGDYADRLRAEGKQAFIAFAALATPLLVSVAWIFVASGGRF